MNREPIVSDIKIIDFSPKFDDPTLRKLIPTRLRSEHMSFTVRCSDAVANGLRRTIVDELPVLRLYCEYSDIETTDVFIIPEMIIKRLRSVPLDQRTPKSARYLLDVANMEMVERDVKMSEFKPMGAGELPFNGTSTICTLKPGRTLRIAAHLAEGIGHIHGEGMYSLGFNAASCALDIVPLNTYERDAAGKPIGVSSREADARVWRIKFTTNGELPCRDIVVRACESIIGRAAAIKSLMYSIAFDGTTYRLSVPGESHTIGNLFMRVLHDLYPDLSAVVYEYDNIERRCTIVVRGGDDINMMFDAAIRYIDNLYKQIAAGIKR